MPTADRSGGQGRKHMKTYKGRLSGRDSVSAAVWNTMTRRVMALSQRWVRSAEKVTKL
jgi:hypothetical protein